VDFRALAGVRTTAGIPVFIIRQLECTLVDRSQRFAE